MKRLWIYPYKMESKSAAVLANEMDVLRIKTKGSTFVGSKDDVILNWGAGTGVYPEVRTGKAKLLNPPAAIDRVINKIAFFYDMMRGLNRPNIPTMTENRLEAQHWSDSGMRVIARTEVEGSKGSGLVVVTPGDKVPYAPLYTLKVPSTNEYRVYMFDGKAIDIREKRPGEDVKIGKNWDGMRFDEEKWFYYKMGGIAAAPAAVVREAERAMKKTGMFTLGIDVLYDAETDTATVLEGNSAPYIGGATAEIYAEQFKQYLA